MKNTLKLILPLCIVLLLASSVFAVIPTPRATIAEFSLGQEEAPVTDVAIPISLTVLNTGTADLDLTTAEFNFEITNTETQEQHGMARVLNEEVLPELIAPREQQQVNVETLIREAGTYEIELVLRYVVHYASNNPLGSPMTIPACVLNNNCEDEDNENENRRPVYRQTTASFQFTVEDGDDGSGVPGVPACLLTGTCPIVEPNEPQPSLAITAFDLNKNSFAINEAVSLTLTVANEGNAVFNTQEGQLDIVVSTQDDEDNNINGEWIWVGEDVEVLAEGETVTYQGTRSFSVADNYEVQVVVTALVGEEQQQVAEVVDFVVESDSDDGDDDTDLDDNNDDNDNNDDDNEDNQSHDKDDAEDAIDDAEDAYDTARCLYRAAEEDLRENYGQARVRESVVERAEDDLRDVDDLIDEAKDQKRDDDYDGAVSKADDAEEDADDIIRTLRRYYHCDLSDYDGRNGDYDPFDYYNRRNNPDDNQRNNQDQDNGNGDFLDEADRQRLLDRLNEVNQNVNTQNNQATPDQQIEVQRSFVPPPVLNNDVQEESKSLFDSGLFVLVLAISAALLVIVEVVLAMHLFGGKPRNPSY